MRRWFVSGFLAAASLIVTAGQIALAQSRHGDGQVVVNNQVLDGQILAGLTQLYGPVPPGEYWYDPWSGLWGMIGGPSTGQILPGLDLGGPLTVGASRSQTGVFVNGREIHKLELAHLTRLFGSVVPGRYWLDASLIGGFEGGPPMFDLRPGAGGAGYNRNTVGGGLMSDGSCAGYLHPDGPTVMTGNC